MMLPINTKNTGERSPSPVTPGVNLGVVVFSLVTSVVLLDVNGERFEVLPSNFPK